MLTALLLAAAQPATLEAALAPPSGSYGWIEQLAGSCFSWENEHRSVVRMRWIECFEKRGGQFVIRSINWHPRYEYTTECVLESAHAGLLRFDCTRHGRPHIDLVAEYDGDAFAMRNASDRLAAHQLLNRQRTVWRRVGEDALAMTVEERDPQGGWRPFANTEPRILTRRVMR